MAGSNMRRNAGRTPGSTRFPRSPATQHGADFQSHGQAAPRSRKGAKPDRAVPPFNLSKRCEWAGVQFAQVFAAGQAFFLQLRPEPQMPGMDFVGRKVAGMYRRSKLSPGRGSQPRLGQYVLGQGKRQRTGIIAVCLSDRLADHLELLRVDHGDPAHPGANFVTEPGCFAGLSNPFIPSPLWIIADPPWPTDAVGAVTSSNLRCAMGIFCQKEAGPGDPR